LEENKKKIYFFRSLSFFAFAVHCYLKKKNEISIVLCFLLILKASQKKNLSFSLLCHLKVAYCILHGKEKRLHF
jgi:hypothetical protein